MFQQLLKVLLIKEMFGSWSEWYGVNIDLCPDLHTTKPGLHPHQCVSYAQICQGVTYVVVKTEANGTQHLCHPGFQPWGAGTLTFANGTVHCGFEIGDQMMMEFTSDDKIKHYCTKLTDEIRKRCLINILYFGRYLCDLCKEPFYGDNCQFITPGWDQRYTNPPQKCNPRCLECNDLDTCTLCLPEFFLIDPSFTDANCSSNCNGFTKCDFAIYNNIELRWSYSGTCVPGLGKFDDSNCAHCPQNCTSCSRYLGPDGTDKRMTCDVCDDNYFRAQIAKDSPDIYGCVFLENCIPSPYNVQIQFYSCINCAQSGEKDACVDGCPETRMPKDSSLTQYECVCIDSDYFDDGFSTICQKCHYTCLTCNCPLPSNCLSFNTTYRELDFASCICPIKYFDIGELECIKCHYSCYQCFDNTVESCVVCSLENHIRVLKGNICKCVDGYYEDLGIALCKKCSYKCETCEIKADKCLTCPLNSFRALDPVEGCYCTQEFYEKDNEVTCQKCHFKCKACDAYGEQNCLTCDELAFRELIVNQCKCKSHYFEMEVQECTICSAFCYECINTFNKCTSCYDDRYLNGNTCKCVTKFQGSTISTFELNGMPKCQDCHYSCATCGGIEETDCLACIDVDQRYQVGNTCLCKEGYFDAGLPICEKCSYKCKGCKQQAEMCISCKDNTLRLYVSGFNKCECIERHYDDGQNDVCQSIYSQSQLQECHYSCLRCNDIDTKCELCSIESNRTLNDQLFTCDCNVGYYDIGIEICQKCHYSCFSCNSGNSNSCITCIDQNTSKRVFYNNTCKCLFGYFDDGQSTSCQKCDIQCLSCIDQSYICLSCPSTRKIEQNCKCQQGYYETGLQLCSECNSNCMNCQFTSTNCISCYIDQFRELNLTTKTCDCQSGYIEINGICQQCYQSCQTCSQYINNCTTCVQFRYLKNNNCLCNEGMYESIVDKQCKLCNKTCLTCAYTSDYCLTCSIDNHRIFKSGNLCLCQQGYYEDPISYNCEECDKSCLTCSLQYDNCLTCDSNLYLSLFQNKCQCQKSYYFDSLTKSCKQCNITCLECNNNNSECISCRVTTRHFDSDTKKCQCNFGYYETNQQNCQQCHFSCETCENTTTHCLSCLDIYQRILINNQCFCKDGYYEVGFELCQKCNSICKTCCLLIIVCHATIWNNSDCFQKINVYVILAILTQTLTYVQNAQMSVKLVKVHNCTSCGIDSKRVDQSIIHRCPCIIGFYEDQNKTCQKCHIKCQTCINQSGQCLSCKIDLNLNRNNLSDLCNCKDGYFDDGTQIQCQKCNSKCLTCENEQHNCLICQNSIRINPPTCNCMNGYYENEQKICQICASQCDTCITSESNFLTCKQGRIGLDCRCNDGYFEFGSTLCDKCAFQCETCDSSQSNCITCKGDRIQEPQCICQSGYYDDLINENCQQCDSLCLECNINGCLSCNANRILNEEMNCIPPPNSIWYNHTSWCSTCQVAVFKPFLSDDISKIIIHFDFPLNPKGFNSQIQINKCLQLFELETVKSFGNSAVCYLNPDDFQELFISQGENSKINIDDQILFQSNSLSHINCQTSIEIFIFTALQMPINPIPPQIQYDIPPHTLNPNAQNLIYVKAIANNGYRKLYNIFWSYEAEENEKREILNQFLEQNNLIQDYNLFIPRFIVTNINVNLKFNKKFGLNTLPSNSLIKFKIQFQNFIHIKSFSEFTLSTHSGEYPQINIYLKPSYFVFEKISVSLSVGTLNQSNLLDNYKYQIQIFEKDRYPQKTPSSQINISIQSNPFEIIYTNISKYTLSPNTTYMINIYFFNNTFQVNATNLMTSMSQIQYFKIHIPFAGLICQFNNRETQSIRKDLNLSIKCKDLDTTYEWNNDPIYKFMLLVKICHQIAHVKMHKDKQFMLIQLIPFNLSRRIPSPLLQYRNGQLMLQNSVDLHNLIQLLFILKMIFLYQNLNIIKAII